MTGRPLTEQEVRGWLDGEVGLRMETLARDWLRLHRLVETQQEACPFCGHVWRRHDPEDGKCDAHSNEGIGVCRCGRDLDWMRDKIAGLSLAALAPSAKEGIGKPRSSGPPYNDQGIPL